MANRHHGHSNGAASGGIISGVAATYINSVTAARRAIAAYARKISYGVKSKKKKGGGKA